MSLKKRLEAVWNQREIACPSHLTRWNEKGLGYSRFQFWGLYYNRGLPRKPKGKKPKGKGFTFLCKNYGLYSRIQVKVSHSLVPRYGTPDTTE